LFNLSRLILFYVDLLIR